MPTGIIDYTTQIAAREAAANDALSRLYIQLAQRREDRLRQQEFMREMLGLRDKYTRGLYDDYGAPGSRGGDKYPNFQTAPGAPLGSGGAGSGAPAPAPAPATPAPATTAPQGSLGTNPTPLGPSTDKFSQNDDPLASFAQAGPDETVTLSAQSRQQRPAYNAPRAPSTTRGTPLGFRQLDPKLIASWDADEVKYKLPRGTILMTLGLENAGGYNLGTNPKSAGGASGVFQFTRELAREHGLSPADLQDPYKMGHALAANIDRNRQNIEKFTGQKLGSGAEDMPYYYMAHMLGAGNAPRVAKALQVNRDTPLVKVLLPTTLPNGRVVDAGSTMANNGIPLNMTVGQWFDKLSTEKVGPWHSSALRLLDGPQGKPQTAAAPPPSYDGRVPTGANYASPRTGYQFGDESAMVTVPYPDGSGRAIVVHKDAAPIVNEFVSRLYEAGAPVNSVVGYVKKHIAGTNHLSQHGFGMSFDVNQRSKNKVDAAFTKWVQDPQNGAVLKQIVSDLQLRSGGDWRSADFGHFEVGPEAIAAWKAREGTAEPEPQQAAAAPPPTAPRKPSEELRPFTGDKLATYGAPTSAPLATMAGNQPVIGKQGVPAGAVSGLLAGMDLAPKTQQRRTVPESQNAAGYDVPTTAPIPPEATAAAAQPTPQTASTVEQPTQATPAPTPQQVQTDSGYTIDDMNETNDHSTRLSAGEPVPMPPTRPDTQSMGGPSRSLRDLPPGMTTIPFGNVLDKAGEVARDIRSVDPMTDVAAGAGYMAGDVAQAVPGVLNAAGGVARDIRSVDPMTDVVQGAGDMVGDAFNYAKSKIMGKPSYNIPPQVQRLIESRQGQEPPPQQAPLPVPAASVAAAMYDQGNQPQYDSSFGQDVSGLPEKDMSGALDWIKALFTRAPKPVQQEAVPARRVPTTMPGGTPIIVPQPKLNIQPKGNALPLPMPNSAGDGSTPQGNIDVQIGPDGQPLFKIME